MDTDFLQAIKRVTAANDAKTHVTSVRQMFEYINSLDAPGIMAAAQTFFFYYSDLLEQIGEDEKTEERLTAIRDAIWARMSYLASQTPQDSRKIIAYAFMKSCGTWWDMALRFFLDAGLSV